MNKSTVLYFSIILLFSSISHATNEMKQVTLAEEQRLTLVLAKNKQGGEKAQKTYIDGVFRLAQHNNIDSLALFSVTQTLAGEYQPEAFAMYAWHNEKVSTQVRQSGDYKTKLKPLQKFGWDELAAADVDMKDLSHYQFDEEKTYTLAEVWLKDAAEYAKYYKGSALFREKIGAKVIFKHTPNEYNSLKRGAQGPDFLILVEWPNKNGPMQYVQSPEFKKYEKYITAGVEKLGWYALRLNNETKQIY
ncbi:DUF1330 domain-containing protein [Pseudoalteromonas sp. C2R02]|uniref:DUF1330 domain-containing protein n=1 Tax=Pseudoalteromonas sp. C2R02 TaxID=2841565 RepID=UPI001C0802BF|nr:DUF1330 domain-containing protein [Pseudoalteromonas sp. C2R02]MBU2968642.1 DUF1330 domain-containing protein [Pseudoalteromonas sp. C2R02]